MGDQDPNLYRLLGELSAGYKDLCRRLDNQETKLDSVVEIANKASGGWRMLVAVWVIASTIAAAATSLVGKLWTLVR